MNGSFFTYYLTVASKKDTHTNECDSKTLPKYIRTSQIEVTLNTSLKMNKEKDEPVVKTRKEANLEFGGSLGVSCNMIMMPLTVYLLQFACNKVR